MNQVQFIQRLVDSEERIKSLEELVQVSGDEIKDLRARILELQEQAKERQRTLTLKGRDGPR